MLKKIAVLGFCAVAFMACGDAPLDPTNPESIRRHYAKLQPPIQMSEDQFVSYVKSSLASIERDTMNMSMFLVVSSDYLNKKNSKGNTALSVAVNKKNPIAVKYLLDRGANLDIRSEQLGMTPLEDASTFLDSTGGKIFGMLVEARKVNDPQLQNIGSALHLAARYGALANVQALVENGANANARNDEGYTPLHEASKEGRKPVVEYLVSRKVEINPVDRDGYTPMDWSAAMGAGSTFPEVTKVLQRAGGRHTAAWRAAQ
ncbi:MAG: ankyrin repeat domain-containing protein [Fibromonadaceae bacterium]|jgi:ankyrin repeat protein|nr:ankyrin repeat domain-containing protein [Fibromonadaceae bacterium]